MCRIVLPHRTCCKSRGCRRGIQRVPTSQVCHENASGCSAVRFLQRDPSGCRRVPTAPVGPIRLPAQDLLQTTRVPTRVQTGTDFAGVLRKRVWLQRRAFLAAGSERVPTGADCATPTTAQPQPHPLSGRSDRCCASEIVIFQSQPIFRTCLNQTGAKLN